MIPIDRRDLERFRDVVAARLGLRYEDGLDPLAEALGRRIEAVGCPGVEPYLERLGAPASGAEELRALAEQLTVGETYFFRNADHFRALRETVLPERVRAAGQRRLRLLSAGCSTGEEAYSLALLLRDELPDLASWDVRILALDVNRLALAKAREGRYSEWSLRATPDEVRRRAFQADGRDFVLDPAVRGMVTFEERNLADEAPELWASLSFDVVFCRNVLMYLTPEVTRSVIARLTAALRPGGFLFLGHAETLRGLSNDHHLCHTHDTFYYRRREEGEAPPTPAPSSPRGGRAGAHPRTEPEALPELFQAATSWVEAIQRASDRITTLTDGRTPAAAGGAAARPEPAPDASAPRRSTEPAALDAVLEVLRQERFGAALELLDALPSHAQRDPDALLLRAVLLANRAELAGAERVCAQLLAQDALNAGAYYVLALCREHHGDRARAADHDQTAVYLDPAFAMPHLHLGLLAKHAGDPATARRELSYALLLLAREDASRLVLFGGGFSREALTTLCRDELRAVGGAP